MDVSRFEQNCAELKSINHRQEKRVRYYETKALQQTISYLIFQIIILLSVSQPSSAIRCNNWWLPFSLSLICAFIFGLTFAATIILYLGAQFQYDLNLLELEMMRSRSLKVDSPPALLEYDKFRMYKRHVTVYSILLSLVAFTGIVLFACHSIPCDGKN